MFCALLRAYPVRYGPAQGRKHCMDPITLGYYAAICALLSLVSPALGSRATRLIIGAAIGAVAALALPMLKGAIQV